MAWCDTCQLINNDAGSRCQSSFNKILVIQAKFIHEGLHTESAVTKIKSEIKLCTKPNLLFGVVQIYSRKSKYLLTDCKETFVKFRKPFRPRAIIDN